MNTPRLVLNRSFNGVRNPIALVVAAALIITACASPSKSPDGALAVRNHLLQLQNDSPLANRAPVAIRIAEAAVTQAEVPRKDKALSEHLVYLAARKVDIAWAQAETRLLESQRKGLAEQSDTARLNSRTREADQARSDSADLRRQITELNAKTTERGLVVTLGDMLFETGKSQLKGNSAINLEKLINFLKAYPDRTLLIEGHTDNVGSNASNMLLSQARADSVRLYLLAKGINTNRVEVIAKGEGYPVASNLTISGRSLNRRVEVVIAD